MEMAPFGAEGLLHGGGAPKKAAGSYDKYKHTQLAMPISKIKVQ